MLPGFSANLCMKTGAIETSATWGSTNVAVTEGHREFPVAKVKKAFIS